LLKLFKRLDHVGILVEDLDRSVARYEALFGVRCESIETLEDLEVRIAHLPIGETEIELAEPVGSSERLRGHLRSHGEGFHHLAFRVDSLTKCLSRLEQAGIRMRDREPRPGSDGSLVAFIDPEETDRVLIELVEKNE